MRKSKKISLLCGCLALFLAVIVCFTAVPNVHAADDDGNTSHNNLSFYNIASAAANYLSNAMAPGGDYNEEYNSAEFNQYFTGTDEGVSFSADIGRAGCFMGYNDKDLSSGVSGWLSSALSISSDTSSTEAFPETEAIYGENPFGKNPFANYIRFGNLLNVLGLDSTRSHTHMGFVRRVSGGIMLVAFLLSTMVNTAFSVVLNLLSVLNPFRFINSVAIAGLEPYADDDTVFGGVAAMITGLYNKISDLSWEAVIPIMFCILIVTLLISKKSDKGHRVLNYVKKIFFVVAGIPLLGSLYTTCLEDMAEGANFNALNYRAVMSTFFDFENWAKNGMPVNPSDELIAVVGQDGESFDAASRSYILLRKFCYMHNPGTDPAVFDGTSDLYSEIGYSDSLIDGSTSADDRNQMKSIISMLTRYMQSDVYEPNEYEFLQKKNFMNVPVNDSSDLESLTDAERQLRMIIGAADPEAYGKTASRSEFSPLYSAFKNDNILFNIDGNSMSSNNSTSFEHPDGDSSVTARSVRFKGKMPPLAVYNYLASDFSRTGVTIYSAAKSSSNLVKRPHFSVNRIGTGISGFAYWLNCFMLVIVSGLIGWFYALSILVHIVKESYDLIKTTPFAMLGSLKSIARTITIVVTMVLEIVMTMFMYLLIMQFMLLLENLAIGPQFASGLFGFTRVVMGELFTAVVFCIFGFMAIKLRKNLVKGASEAMENWLNTVITGQPGAGYMSGPKAPNAFERAGGSIANGVGMAAGAALAGKFMGSDATGGDDAANGTKDVDDGAGFGDTVNASDTSDGVMLSESDAKRISDQTGESLRGLPAGTGATTVGDNNTDANIDVSDQDGDANIDGGDSMNIVNDSSTGGMVSDVANIDPQMQQDMESLQDANGNVIVPHGGAIDSDGTVLDADGNPVHNADGSVKKIDSDLAKKYGTTAEQRAAAKQAGKRIGETATGKSLSGVHVGVGKSSATEAEKANAKKELARAAHDNQMVAAKLASITGQPAYTPKKVSAASVGTGGALTQAAGGVITMPDGTQVSVPDDQRAVMTSNGDVAVDANGQPIMETAAIAGFDGKPVQIPEGYQPVRDSDGYYKMNADGTPVLQKSDSLNRAVNAQDMSARYDAPATTAQSVKAVSDEIPVFAKAQAGNQAGAQVGTVQMSDGRSIPVGENQRVACWSDGTPKIDANGNPIIEQKSVSANGRQYPVPKGMEPILDKNGQLVMGADNKPVFQSSAQIPANDPKMAHRSISGVATGSDQTVSAVYKPLAEPTIMPNSSYVSAGDGKVYPVNVESESYDSMPSFAKAQAGNQAGAQVGTLQMSDGRSIPVGENQRVACWSDGTPKIDANGNPIIEQKSVSVNGRQYSVPKGMEPILDKNGQLMMDADNNPVFQPSTQVPINNSKMAHQSIRGVATGSDQTVSAVYKPLAEPTIMPNSSYVSAGDGKVYPVNVESESYDSMPSFAKAQAGNQAGARVGIVQMSDGRRIPVGENQRVARWSNGMLQIDANGNPIIEQKSVSANGKQYSVPNGMEPVLDSHGQPVMDAGNNPVFQKSTQIPVNNPKNMSHSINDSAMGSNQTVSAIYKPLAEPTVMPNNSYITANDGRLYSVGTGSEMNTGSVKHDSIPSFAKAQTGNQSGVQVGVVRMSDGRNIPVGANQRVVCDVNGKPQVDAMGNPIIEQVSVSANGRQYVVPNGMEPIMDRVGQPVMGADNKPVFRKSTQIAVKSGVSGSGVSASYESFASPNAMPKNTYITSIDGKIHAVSEQVSSNPQDAAGILNRFSLIQTPSFTRTESGAQVGTVQMSDGRNIPVGENQRVVRWSNGVIKVDGNGNPIIEQKSVTVGGRRYAVPAGMEPVLDGNGNQMVGRDHMPVFQKSTQIPANNPAESRMKGAPNVSGSYKQLRQSVPMKSNGFVTTGDGRVYPVPENQMPVMTSTKVPAVDGSGKPMFVYTAVPNKAGRMIPVPKGQQPVLNASGVPQLDRQGEPMFRPDSSVRRIANDPIRAYRPTKAQLAQTVARTPVIPNAKPVEIPTAQIQETARRMQASLNGLSTVRTKADARSAIKLVYEQIAQSSMTPLVKNMVAASLIHEFAPNNLLGDAMRGAAAGAVFAGQDYARKNYAHQQAEVSRAKPTRNRIQRVPKDPTLDNIYATIASLDVNTHRMISEYESQRRNQKRAKGRDCEADCNPKDRK